MAKPRTPGRRPPTRRPTAPRGAPVPMTAGEAAEATGAEDSAALAPGRVRRTPPAGSPDGDWFRERGRDLGVQQQEIAARLEIDVSVYQRVLAGDRRCQISEALALADILRAPPAEIVRRLGYAWPDQSVPVVSRIGPAGDVSIALGTERVPSPVELPPGAAADRRRVVAAIVDAPHSPLAVYDGATIYYLSPEGVDPAAIGRLAIIEVIDHPCPVLGVLDRASAGHGSLTVFGTGVRVVVRRIVSCTPVLWVRLA